MEKVNPIMPRIPKECLSSVFVSEYFLLAGYKTSMGILQKGSRPLTVLIAYILQGRILSIVRERFRLVVRHVVRQLQTWLRWLNRKRNDTLKQTLKIKGRRGLYLRISHERCRNLQSSVHYRNSGRHGAKLGLATRTCHSCSIANHEVVPYCSSADWRFSDLLKSNNNCMSSTWKPLGVIDVGVGLPKPGCFGPGVFDCYLCVLPLLTFFFRTLSWFTS